MKKVSLSGSPRENVGKKDAKELRANDRVPAVLYGGDDQTHFSLAVNDVDKIVFTPDVFLVTLNIGGKEVKAVMKDIQFHPVTDQVIHVDFLEVIDGKPVKLELPVQTTGNSIGVRNGGRLALNFRRVKVMGLPADFPDAIVVDISKLRIGMAIRISDITIPGVTLLHEPNSVLVAVKTARGAVDEAEEDEEGEEGAEGDAEGDGEAAKTEEAAAE